MAVIAASLVFGNLTAQTVTEDFDAYIPEQKGWPPDGWVLNGTAGSEWTWGTTPHSGVYNAWTDMLVGGEAGLLNCNWTVLPLCDPKLCFFYRGGYDYYGYEVAFTVEIATTRCCPSQFTSIWDSGQFSCPDIYDDHTQACVDLSAYAGQQVLIGFRAYYIDNPSYELQIDDVKVTELSAFALLGPEDFTPPPPAAQV